MNFLAGFSVNIYIIKDKQEGNPGLQVQTKTCSGPNLKYFAISKKAFSFLVLGLPSHFKAQDTFLLWKVFNRFDVFYALMSKRQNKKET